MVVSTSQEPTKVQGEEDVAELRAFLEEAAEAPVLWWLVWWGFSYVDYDDDEEDDDDEEEEEVVWSYATRFTLCIIRQ